MVRPAEVRSAAMDTFTTAPDLVRPALGLVAAGIPALFAGGAMFVPARRPFGPAVVLGGVAFVLSIAASAAAAIARCSGPLPFAVRMDALTATLLLLVTGIGLVILRFSRSSLDREPAARRYVRGLMATLAAVTALVVTNHLLVFALAWVTTSVSLHTLLTFFGSRTGALIAAHKKFLVSRLADLALLGGIVLIALEVGSERIDAVAAWCTVVQTLPPRMQLAAVLLAIGAALKCAQLPFHGWLIQVMEAPTPVSALLHAGVVNLGGVLMMRLAPLFAHAAPAQTLLVCTGSVTAVVAALVMTTRVSVKVALAWSTCAQMGFMLVQCGLGAYDLALLHLVAHSLYKAHAFLSAGSAVEVWQGQALAPPSPSVSLRRAAVSLMAAAVIVAGAAATAGVRPAEEPAVWALGAVLIFALGSLIAGSPRGDAASRGRSVAVAVGVAFAYFGWHALFRTLLPAPASTVAAAPRIAVVWAAFGALFAVQVALQARPGGWLARALYPRLYAGLYLDEAFTRLTFRVWPPRLAAPGLGARSLPQLGNAEV